MGKAGNGRRKGRRITREEARAAVEAEQQSIITATYIEEQFDDGSGDFSPGNMSDDKLVAEATYRITVMKDHTLDYPDLYMEIFLVGKDGNSDALFAQMFARSGCKKAKSIEEADLVVFVGGPDVNPAYYGEEPHETTNYDEDRDIDDINAYAICLEMGIPMLGICRGAQFLHVMNGGKLYQDVDNHYGDHPMNAIKDKIRIDRVSSVHHQMVIPNKDMMITGVSTRAENRWRNPTENDSGNRVDVEAFFYRDTCCYGIQGHPEYRTYNYFTVWALKQIQLYVVENPDLDWPEEGGRFRRIKKDLLEQRAARASPDAPGEGVLATIGRKVN